MSKKLKKRKKKDTNHIHKLNKDILINKLLFVVIFSIITFILLKFIYIGYIHVNYVLGMPKTMITISIVSFAVAIFYGYKCFGKSKNLELINFFIISLACGVSCIAIYFYSLYAIRALWCVIGVYMVLSFVYYIFMYNKGKNQNSISK